MSLNNKISRNTFFPAIAVLAAVSALLGIATGASAQQLVIDDAAVTTARSFQIETWHGPDRFWFMPALGVKSFLEISVAFVYDSDQSYGLAGWVLEAKAVTADLEETGQAFSLAVGSIFDAESSFTGLYANIPYSRSIWGGRSIVHVNIGGILTEPAVGRDFSFIYGIRGDFGLNKRMTLLAELFGQNRDLGFNIGVRVGLIPDLLSMDITYGRGFKTGVQLPGGVVGLAITPPSLW